MADKTEKLLQDLMSEIKETRKELDDLKNIITQGATTARVSAGTSAGTDNDAAMVRPVAEPSPAEVDPE